ncbi:hypothetical protein [Spirillospora sp. NBC_01491]|uniref:hypothetical protein n=1 Tax=Spirillospora sp. NBC_01491 TaxID=2976007 RepID=UPI002E347E51|nr:hypothetical protein [Spirillospora sp. NBC_01491]
MSTCEQGGCRSEAQTRGRCESHYRQRIRMGIYGWRDAGPAREHVAALRTLGWTWEQIADAADLSTYVAHQIGRGKTRHLLPESERALLAVPLEARDSQRSIDSTGTRRRVQALAWMGWPAREVAARAGTTQATLQTLILPNRRISHALARRVAAVYDELCMTPGPSRIAAGKARAAGFAPPLAWPDDLIDAPTAAPDLGEKSTRRDALLEDTEELLRQRFTLEQVADRLKVTAGYLAQLRREALQAGGVAA